jgi:hypothetical protein
MKGPYLPDIPELFFWQFGQLFAGLREESGGRAANQWQKRGQLATFWRKWPSDTA